MTISTLPGTFLDAPSGADGSVRIVGPVLSATRSPSIRRAGLTDIPGIAQITQEGSRSAGVETAAMSRATRLLLTHVAFEHGALWVEQVEGAPIARAVTAIPVGELLSSHSVLRDVIRRLGRPVAPPPVPVFGFGEVLLAELKLVRPTWLLIEISKPSQNLTGDPGLLGAALQWAGDQSVPAGDPVMVLTDTMPERRAAESLGFVERRTWGRRWPWWLGVTAPVTRSSGA